MKKKVIGTRIFQWTICSCGCKKFYWKWLNPEKPVTYKIIKDGHQWNTNSVWGSSSRLTKTIEREDGQQFSVGDTIQTITPMGKKYNKCVIYWIQIEKNNFLQIHCHVIGKKGNVVIRNEKIWMNSGSDPNNFKFIINLTKN